MHIFQQLRDCIISKLELMVKNGELPTNLSYDNITAESPRDPSHGDVATNAAMVLAKSAQMKPREIAEKLQPHLESVNYITSVEIAGPGFINLRLDNSFYHQELDNILQAGINYGDSTLGNNEKINIEYVSANPTGPMHIGHARGAVVGDSLMRLLKKAGYDVTTEFYINDAGSQINTLADSAFLRYREALGEKITIPEGLYPGEYLVPVGQSLKEKFSDSLLNMDEEERLATIKKHTIAAMLELIKNDLKRLGIEHDIFTSELDIHNRNLVEKSLAILEEKGLIYKGVLEPPKGKLPDDWEEREQTLFRSSKFGDDVDRPLIKSDGNWTYFAADLAYHLDKIERGYNKMILGLGKDHGGYVTRLKAGVKALSDNKASVEVVIHDLVNFLDNGTPVKMSKRAGTFTTVNDVLDKLDKDIIRFIMLTRKNDAVLDFDLVKTKEKSKDNPVFYVQYAHARICSVLRHAATDIPQALEQIDQANLSLLKNDAELTMIKVLTHWPRIVEGAAKTLEPHKIVFYLQDLAAEFHSLWNHGKENTILRFIVMDDKELTAARLALLTACSIVLSSGLALLNIKPIEEM